MTLDEINSYLYDNIPMIAFMDVRVASYDGKTVVVTAPLGANQNPKATAFGGSLSALGIISGWVLLFLKLKENGFEPNLVIRKSVFDFQAPVEEDFMAICAMPSTETWESFLHTLRRRGHSRIVMQSEIKTSSRLCGCHEGIYVAVSDKLNRRYSAAR